jgi:hypothetical protein
MADLSQIYDDFGECSKLGNAKKASTSTSEMLYPVLLDWKILLYASG